MIDEQTKYLSEYRMKKADTLLIQAEFRNDNLKLTTPGW